MGYCVKQPLPTTAIVEAGPATIYVLHDIHELDLDPAAAGIQIVVSGHSHKPSCTKRSGSAGPRRFRLPATIARLDLAMAPWKITLVEVAGK